MPRRPFSAAQRQAQRAALEAELLAVAEDLWRAVEGGPTLEMVAAEMFLSTDGLDKRLRRAGLRWAPIKDHARQRISGRFRPLTAA